MLGLGAASEALLRPRGRPFPKQILAWIPPPIPRKSRESGRTHHQPEPLAVQTSWVTAFARRSGSPTVANTVLIRPVKQL